MPENPEVQSTDLVIRLRSGADKLHAFDLHRGVSPESGLMTGAIIDLRQAANTVEDLIQMLRELEAVATALHRVATHKGMLFVTDPETGSDKLVGMFVPPHLVNDLGREIKNVRDAIS